MQVVTGRVRDSRATVTAPICALNRAIRSAAPTDTGGSKSEPKSRTVARDLAPSAEGEGFEPSTAVTAR